MERTVATTLLIAVGIAIFYTILVYWKGAKPDAKDNIWSWWHGLISTFVSVLLGITVAIWLLSYQDRKTDQTERQKYRRLLTAELSDARRVLSLPDKSKMVMQLGGTNYYILAAYVQPIILEEAARSNLFDPVDTENMLLLARNMRTFNLLIDHLMEAVVLATDQHANNIRYLVESQESGRQTLLENIDLIKRQMRLEWSPSVDLQY